MELKFSLWIVLLAANLVLLVSCDRQAKRITSSTGSDGNFKSPCGDGQQVSRRIGLCVAPIMEMVENKIPDPKSDQDLVANCERFGVSEKCVRGIAKDCLSGLHKTAVGSIATATKRYRAQECKSPELRAKYMEPLKCSNRMGSEMLNVSNNMTAMAQAIRDSKISPEEKMVKICCLLQVLDKEIEARFNRDCPESTSAILGIVHAMTDDARNTLCRNPKCTNALNGLKNAKYKPPQNLLEPIMQILFMISTE